MHMLNFKIPGLSMLPIDIRKPICDFLLIVNSNCGCITYRSRDIFAYRAWKSPVSSTVFWLYTLAEESPAVSMLYIHRRKTFNALQFYPWQQESIL